MTRNADQYRANKVLIVANEWSRNGGLEIVTQDVARAFADLGWQVTVVPAGGIGKSEILANGIHVHWVPPRGRIAQSLWCRYLRWIILPIIIKKHLKGGGLLIFGHVRLLPLIDRLPEALNISRWVWTHGVDAWGKTARGWMPRLNQLDNVVAVSEYTARHERQEGATTQVSVILNSIDTERYTPTQTPEKIRRDEVLICSRLCAAEKYKGHEVLFDALPIAEKLLGRPLKLRVIGTGDDEPRLRQRAKELGVDDRVLFCGRVTDAELLEAYRHCGVFAMPSRAEYRPDTDDWAGEGFGLVYVEAAACGRPVIASSEGGAPETIIHEKTGLLADPRSPQANAVAIARVLGDERWADELGRAGREHAVTHFSFDSFKRRVLEVVSADKKLQKLGCVKANIDQTSPNE